MSVGLRVGGGILPNPSTGPRLPNHRYADLVHRPGRSV